MSGLHHGRVVPASMKLEVEAARRPAPEFEAMDENRTNTGTLEGSSPSGTVMNDMRICAHCGLQYNWRRSASSSLKMTYCGALCERAGLGGFTIDYLLRDWQPVSAVYKDALDPPAVKAA